MAAKQGSKSVKLRLARSEGEEGEAAQVKAGAKAGAKAGGGGAGEAAPASEAAPAGAGQLLLLVSNYYYMYYLMVRQVNMHLGHASRPTVGWARFTCHSRARP